MKTSAKYFRLAVGP